MGSFDAALSATTNVDTIENFSTLDDTIQLENAVFVGLSAGGLPSAAFYSSSTATGAHDSSDRIVYNTSTGELYYDWDGTGGTCGAVTVGLLDGSPSDPGYADFWVS